MNHALSITHDGTLKIVLPKGYEVNKVIVKSGKEMMEFSAVLRCKDCKWWTKQEMSLQGRCALYGMYPTGEWYCGNARREN